MKVRNSNQPLGKVTDFKKRTYQGDAFGVFDVPPEFGNWLCGTPHWEPVSGVSLGDVVSKPAGMSEEAHAKKLVAAEKRERDRLAKAKAAEDAVIAAKASDVARADNQERQVLDSKKEVAETGPDLDGMSKKELLVCAALYAEKGYTITVSETMTKAVLKSTISEALYGKE